MLKQKERRNTAVDRLASALTHHREHRPLLTDRPYIQSLAFRFGIGSKTMELAISMMAGGTNIKEKK